MGLTAVLHPRQVFSSGDHIMNILLTFTGFHDPYFKGLVDQEEQAGPILSLLTTRPFAHIFLFDTPATAKITHATQSAIIERHPHTQVHICELQLSDPTDYREILVGLKAHYPAILQKYPSADLFVAVASGTPQMHACWVMLTASGKIPARILHVRPPRYVTRERPLVSELDFSAPEFPAIRFADEPAPVSQIDHHPLIGEQVSGTSRTSGRYAAPSSPPEAIGLSAEKARRSLDIVGDHPAMQRALTMGAQLALSSAPILIQGETGTGKELFARFIHILSGYAGGPFVPVNCAAIPNELAESALFGHKKGAFTGATTDQKGLFDAADGGTLFLDELGELSAASQAKLLRVLQDGIVEPVGQTRGRRVNVRIVAATNRNVRDLVSQGQFRQDLYYRLNVGEIYLPPLRERRSDIPKLALHILGELNAGQRNFRQITKAALVHLEAYDWPGNVRELNNILERSALLSYTPVMDVQDIELPRSGMNLNPLDGLPQPCVGFNMKEVLSTIRCQYISQALKAAGGDQKKASLLLGISPQAVNKFCLQQQESSPEN